LRDRDRRGEKKVFCRPGLRGIRRNVSEPSGGLRSFLRGKATLLRGGKDPNASTPVGLGKKRTLEWEGKDQAETNKKFLKRKRESHARDVQFMKERAPSLGPQRAPLSRPEEVVEERRRGGGKGKKVAI